LKVIRSNQNQTKPNQTKPKLNNTIIISLYVAVAFELKGRIRLVQELGRHWSIITGEECFQVFHENLNELTRNIDLIPINEHDSTKSI